MTKPITPQDLLRTYPEPRFLIDEIGEETGIPAVASAGEIFYLTNHTFRRVPPPTWTGKGTLLLTKEEAAIAQNNTTLFKIRQAWQSFHTACVQAMMRVKERCTHLFSAPRPIPLEGLETFADLMEINPEWLRDLYRASNEEELGPEIEISLPIPKLSPERLDDTQEKEEIVADEVDLDEEPQPTACVQAMMRVKERCTHAYAVMGEWLSSCGERLSFLFSAPRPEKAVVSYDMTEEEQEKHHRPIPPGGLDIIADLTGQNRKVVREAFTPVVRDSAPAKQEADRDFVFMVFMNGNLQLQNMVNEKIDEEPQDPRMFKDVSTNLVANKPNPRLMMDKFESQNKGISPADRDFPFINDEFELQNMVNEKEVIKAKAILEEALQLPEDEALRLPEDERELPNEFQIEDLI